MRNKTLFIYLLLASLLILSGCKLTKDSVKSKEGVEYKSAKRLVEDVLNAELFYSTISAKGHIEIGAGDKKKRVSTIFTLVKDNIIQASVRPILGMEAMRITITPDSVFLIDRLKKRYVADSFKDLGQMKNVGFNFNNLQALLTNQIFLSGQNKVERKDYKSFKVSSTKDANMLTTSDKNGITYNFAIDANDRVVSTLITLMSKGISMQWAYSDFVENDNHIYPKRMDATLDAGKIKMNVGISYSKLDIDNEVEVNTSTPKKYTVSSLKDVISSYMKVLK